MTAVLGVDEILQPVRWRGDTVELIDQTRLPSTFELLRCRTVDEVAAAIKTMKVRGAPAIGVTAAYGFSLAALLEPNNEMLPETLDHAFDCLVVTRPTAVNLLWALDRMRACYEGARHLSLTQVQSVLVDQALRIHRESYDADLSLSTIGARVMAGKTRILTHCNAGPLATAGYGTAVGVIRKLHEADDTVTVVADETRPFLQGARLTAWELAALNIPVTVITDNMAGTMMQQGAVDAVVVGADRVAANGDVANKIGTYSLAVLARAHDIPFYVAAPVSTVDLSTPHGSSIPIEERNTDEVMSFAGVRVVADGASARNPAFDVTPNHLVTAIFTENGMATQPYEESLRRVVAGSSAVLAGRDEGRHA